MKEQIYPNPYDFGYWRSAPGKCMAKEWKEILPEWRKGQKMQRPKYCSMVDKAWMVCLVKAGIVDKTKASKIFEALEKIKEEDGFGGEVSLIPALDGDEDTGSLINLGRTLQEPMSRMFIRESLLDFADSVLELQKTLLVMIEKHADTLMPGHTHFSQANPITLASFLLGVYDELNRGLLLLEHAYIDVDLNTGGCGSTSGTAWPVDRQLMTELLGFSKLSEPTYEGEASQDHTLTAYYAMTNISLVLSKAATNFEIWGMDEIGMVNLDPSWHGVSSYMPQKSHPGSVFEWVRVMCSGVTGKLSNAISLYKGEFHGDVMAMLNICNEFDTSDAKGCVKIFDGAMKNLTINKEKMLTLVKDGFSCATELVVHLVKEKGFGGRRAHRITGTFVRKAREKGLKPYECTAEMLDAAALSIKEEAPGITTAELVKTLDPEEFMNSHKNIGGIAPQETLRLLKKRQDDFEENNERQNKRREKLAKADEYLKAEISDILKG